MRSNDARRWLRDRHPGAGPKVGTRPAPPPKQPRPSVDCVGYARQLWALAVAQERLRGLEERVSLEREWPTMAEERLALVQASLPAPPVQEQPPPPRRWFWPWGKG